MKKSLLNILVCPACKKKLVLKNEETTDSGEITSGLLECTECSSAYPVTDGIPRMIKEFGSQKETSKSFGFQWNRRKSRLFENKTLYSRSVEEEVNAFLERMDISKSDLENKLVLDAGCGSGRLTSSLTKHNCETVGIDLSNPLLAYQTSVGNPKVHIVQADIFNLPFKDETFDYVWSEGVLHATPDAKKAFSCIMQKLKKQGKGYIWLYEKSPHERIRQLIKSWKIPHWPLFIMSYGFVILWAGYYFLKTVFNIRQNAFFFFDALSPKYQSEHNKKEIKGWFNECGFKNIDIGMGTFPMNGYCVFGVATKTKE